MYLLKNKKIKKSLPVIPSGYLPGNMGEKIDLLLLLIFFKIILQKFCGGIFTLGKMPCLLLGHF